MPVETKNKMQEHKKNILKQKRKNAFSTIRMSVPFLVLFLSFSPLFHAQESIKLSYENASWTNVMSGKAILKPEQTSYGFVVLTDGKLFTGYSESGKKLWDHAVKTKNPNFISVLSGDFAILVADLSNVSLVNPSGLTLWSKDVGFEITGKPVTGKDGRILVQGKEEIACIGVNGIQKWSMKTPKLKNIPIQELDDGTLVAFLEESHDGKDNGLRFSPFGFSIETITFAARISDAKSTAHGLLLSFLDGGIGLVSAKKDKDGRSSTVTKWAIPSDDGAFSQTIPSRGIMLVPLEKSMAALLKNSSGNVKIILFGEENGIVENIFHVPEISFDNLTCASRIYGKEGIFLSDGKNATVTDTAGKCIYTATLPSKENKISGWNYLFYTKENHIVLTGFSWTLNAFRTIVSVGRKKTETGKKKNLFSYENLLKLKETRLLFSYIPEIPRDIVSEERLKALLEGNYGSKEMRYSEEIFSICQGYMEKSATVSITNGYENPSSFYTDFPSLSFVFKELSTLGTDDSARLIANLIKNETNDALLKTLVNAAGDCGYDPENLMLDAIRLKMSSIYEKKSAVLVSMSDSVLKICRFMGRPSFFAYGMEIQKTLLSPKYPSVVREEARKNLSKIAELKI